MRVALFTDTFAPQINGVTMTLNRLVQYWQRQGIQFLVFAPDHGGQGVDAAEIRRVPSFPFPLYPECRIPLSGYAGIERELLVFKPDLLHLVTPFTLGLIGHRFGQRHNVPMVASYHTNFDQYLDYYRVPFLKKMYWSYHVWFHSYCDRNYCPSTSTKVLLERNGIKNLEIWSRGIDAGEYAPELRNPRIREKYGIGEGKMLLLYVGRVAPEKDIEVLLDSYKTLPPDVAENVHLIVVGDGPLMPKIASDKSGITFTGYLRGRELAEIYASCDLFVFPSGTETFGNVVLEAMASGLPVVGVEAGGVTDIITHMKNGVLCPARSVEGFRDGISMLVRNEDLRLQMARSARINAVKRDWDSIFTELTKSYRSVIEQSVCTGRSVGF